MTRTNPPLLEVEALKKHYPMQLGLFHRNPKIVHAVDGVDLAIERGEIVAVVGESGCGKSTIGRSILGLVPPTAGQIRFEGTRIDNLRGSLFRTLRKRIQVVFQDPFSSLNPRMKVRDIIAEPLVNFRLVPDRAALNKRVEELLDQVHLPHDAAARFPHEFSGGQRQRIGIARALAPNPDLIILDEAVSALDVSVKAQIINLLAELRERLSVAMLFISHDLAIVEHISDRIVVMYLGKVAETGSREAVFSRPAHPYTQALLSAIPVPDPMRARQRIVLKGDIPSPVNPAPGCRFKARCPYAFQRCQAEEPVLRDIGNGHLVACHLEKAPEFDLLSSAQVHREQFRGNTGSEPRSTGSTRVTVERQADRSAGELLSTSGDVLGSHRDIYNTRRSSVALRWAPTKP